MLKRVKEKGQNKPCGQIYQPAGRFTFGSGGITFRGDGIDFGGGSGSAKARYERKKLQRVTEWVRV
jgi:hypothetical protein